jgi:hypothetical protein
LKNRDIKEAIGNPSELPAFGTWEATPETGLYAWVAAPYRMDLRNAKIFVSKPMHKLPCHLEFMPLPG